VRILGSNGSNAMGRPNIHSSVRSVNGVRACLTKPSQGRPHAPWRTTRHENGIRLGASSRRVSLCYKHRSIVCEPHGTTSKPDTATPSQSIAASQVCYSHCYSSFPSSDATKSGTSTDAGQSSMRDLCRHRTVPTFKQSPSREPRRWERL